MLWINAFRESARARTVFVTDIGGIWRADSHTIKETFITQLPNQHGDLQSVAAVHLIWPAHAWISAAQMKSFAIEEYKRGGGFLALPGVH